MKSMRLCRMDFIIQTCLGLFRLGAGGLDYLAQRHDFGAEQLVEGVGGAAGRVYSLARQLVLEVGCRNDLVHRAIQARDDFPRRRSPTRC